MNKLSVSGEITLTDLFGPPPPRLLRARRSREAAANSPAYDQYEEEEHPGMFTIMACGKAVG